MPYKDPERQKQAQRNAYLKKMGRAPEFAFDIPARRAAERLKALGPEIAARYATGESARELARRYGISKTTVRGIAERFGLDARSKKDAGALLRTRKPSAPVHADPSVSVAEQVALHMGYASSAGLSDNREFRTACARENRRRNPDTYRKTEARRKKHQNRFAPWADRKKVAFFYEMASDLGLEVDHEVSLQAKNVCGLHVETNLRLVSKTNNMSKGNKVLWKSDPLVGPPMVIPKGSTQGSTTQDFE